MENRLVEKLVATVARAFYPDNFVVVLELLFYERFVRQEQIAPRLRLSEKEVQKVVKQLENELLIKSENNIFEDNRQVECYYIDYQTFVNVVRYRIHLMQEELKVKDGSELDQVFYKCPLCNRIFSLIEVQKCADKDYKFICTDCCPEENYRAVSVDNAYKLVEVDNRGKTAVSKRLERKMLDQLKENELHAGILDILDQLKEKTLIRNLPSDNIKSGLGPSMIADSDVQTEVTVAAGTMKELSKAVTKHLKEKVGLSITFESEEAGYQESLEPPTKIHRSVVESTGNNSSRQFVAVSSEMTHTAAEITGHGSGSSVDSRSFIAATSNQEKRPGDVASRPVPNPAPAPAPAPVDDDADVEWEED